MQNLSELIGRSTPYRVFDSSYFADEVKPDTHVLEFELLGKKALLHYQPNYFTAASHLCFYAASGGWDLLSETGYKSFWFPHEKPTVEDVLSWFKSSCEELFKDDSPQLSMF